MKSVWGTAVLLALATFVCALAGCPETVSTADKVPAKVEGKTDKTVTPSSKAIPELADKTFRMTLATGGRIPGSGGTSIQVDGQARSLTVTETGKELAKTVSRLENLTDDELKALKAACLEIKKARPPIFEQAVDVYDGGYLFLTIVGDGVAFSYDGANCTPPKYDVLTKALAQVAAAHHENKEDIGKRLQASTSARDLSHLSKVVRIYTMADWRKVVADRGTKANLRMTALSYLLSSTDPADHEYLTGYYKGLSAATQLYDKQFEARWGLAEGLAERGDWAFLQEYLTLAMQMTSENGRYSKEVEDAMGTIAAKAADLVRVPEFASQVEALKKTAGLANRKLAIRGLLDWLAANHGQLAWRGEHWVKI